MNNTHDDRRENDDRLLERILGFERSTHDRVADLSTKISLIEAAQERMSTDVTTLVSRLEFTPVKLLVYGMTSITLAAVVGALMTIVLK